ncbi:MULTISPECIES: glutathione S-transferase family protein [Phenylobacterium]|uniref:Glutathione S-transferase n=1 Tax=Phenylobacterium koreense TaxID=266125 RepID=A0ABV2EMR7_9CAUL
MKLYDTPIAPNPRRVRWVMAEKGIDDIEVVALNLIQGEHKQADYLEKAGLPNVPALEMDDGVTITESIAICRYLESIYPEPNLFGGDVHETAVIEMWMRRAEMLVATPFMLAVRHTHPALAALETQNPPVADYNRDMGLRGLRVLDRRLAQSEWLGGERLTIADIVAFIGIDFTRMIKLPMPEEMTHLGRWMQAMRERPAAKAGMS